MSAILLLPLQARARLRIRVTITLAVAPTKVGKVRWRHTVAMPNAIAVVEFPRRRNLQIAIYIVDNGYTRSTRLVLVSVLIDDRLKHFLRYDGLAIGSFYGVHEVLERVRNVSRIENPRREF
jgi:hypothetical protein